MDECALCKTEAVVRNSHVYPEFVYKSTYDEKGRALYVESDGSGRPPFIQKGLREELLCQSCETGLSKDERYFKRIWFDEGWIPETLNEEYLVIEGFDYEKVKLFLLSVIWRASVCSTPPFAQVDLGPHEELIRSILRNRDAPPPDRYQMMGRLLVSRRGNRVNREFVVTPRRMKLGSLWVYEMVFASTSWILVVSSDSRGDLRDLALKDPGELLLTRLFVDEYDGARDLYLSGRLDYD